MLPPNKQFTIEHRRLSEQLETALATEARLRAEIERDEALSAGGQSLPPSHNETRWLRDRAEINAIGLRARLNRLERRRDEVIIDAVLKRVRARWPKELAQIEGEVRQTFQLEGAV